MSISAQAVSDAFGYCPATGFIFDRKDKTRRLERVHLQKTSGYRSLRVPCFGTTLLSHRIAWMCMNNQSPPAQIDHLNGDSLDNRWLNLRDGEKVNKTNCLMYKNNKSGVTGVYWSESTGKWKTQVRHLGRRYSLGSYAEIRHAEIAVTNFRAARGFTARHGKRLISISA
ncbi:HNH endonuclease [Vreelandella venusta]|uniref:HNH endonuclease n=1 Tax=Vreelandella venusta TaxID=44935 RepID=UPI003F67542D